MVKKVFVASDIHDDVEALRGFTDYAAAQEADLIACLGDFSLRPYTKKDLMKFAKDNDVPSFIESKRKHNGEVIRSMKQVLDSSGVPYKAIQGNYDSDLTDEFEDHNLDGNSMQFGDAKVSGYGGADAFPQHIKLLVQLGEVDPLDNQKLYEFLMSQDPDIVMSHNPPKQLCDTMFNGEHVGTPALTKYITEKGPKLVLSGHIHEAGPYGKNPEGVKGISGYENPNNGKSTIVVNPGNLGRFELVDFPNLETQMQFPYGTFSQVDVEDNGTPTRVTHFTLDNVDRGIGRVRKLEEIIL